MNVKDFISNYKNHPVLFVGTGISLRYLENSFTWDGLLSHIAYELKENHEYYFDIKSECEENSKYKLDKIATILEKEFNLKIKEDREGKFKEINDLFYEKMKGDINISRFKLYLSKIFSKLDYRDSVHNELSELKKTRKNIGSIITTNYDNLIEDIFEFEPLIGNDILLSNPYGSVYKIHGSSSSPNDIILTEDDYIQFDKKYELIRAQLLSLFIHNPIIFIGYSIEDENIKKILKIIFTYLKPNSELLKKIRNNFLLVEYKEGSNNEEISEHDIDMEGFSTIRINKIKTDNFTHIYKALSQLQLPISAMDIRKVQTIVKDIYSGGDIKVSITEDLDSLKNRDKVLVIGSNKTISYQYQTSSEMMANYFKIIEEENYQLLVLIDKYKISTQQYFPIFGFKLINNKIKSISKLEKIQLDKITQMKDHTPDICKEKYTNIQSIIDNDDISNTNKMKAIIWNTLEEKINIESIEKYLRNCKEKDTTDYRKLLCAYDYTKYKHLYN